jgi:hypothetical protein
MNDIDLNAVTENLDSTVSVSDARMLGIPGVGFDRQGSEPTNTLSFDPSAFFDMQLPPEADWLADTALLQSEGYPIMVEDFTSDWATNYNL